MIPKKIHYCWFGKNAEPKLMKKCIASWKRFLPDYKIKRWDETNSPLNEKFLADALKQKKWSRASDFARYFAVFNEGGLYFDTDVEALKSFNSLLGEKCFFGFQSDCSKNCPPLNKSVACGVFGAERQNPFIGELLEGLRKIPAKKQAPYTGPQFLSEMLIKKGLKKYADFPFKIAGVKLFPLKYFYSHPLLSERKKLSKKHQADCYSVHYWTASWVESENIALKARVFLMRLKTKILSSFKKRV